MVSIPFKREGTGEPTQEEIRQYRKKVSIPFKREGTGEQPLFCTQSGRGTVHPKTKRELREAFFLRKFGAKIRQTLVNTDPNAIFRHKRLGSQTPSAFLGNFRRIRTQSANRVCVYKYILNLHKCQTFL